MEHAAVSISIQQRNQFGTKIRQLSFLSMPLLMLHSLLQRPRFFRSAPRIVTAGLVQHRTVKSDWLRIRNETLSLFRKSGPNRGRDSWRRPKDARPQRKLENAYSCLEVKTTLERFTEGRRNLELRTVSHSTLLKQPITWKLCLSFLFLERMTPIAKHLSSDLRKKKKTLKVRNFFH